MKYLRKFNESSEYINKLLDDVSDCFAELIDDKKVRVYKYSGESGEEEEHVLVGLPAEGRVESHVYRDNFIISVIELEKRKLKIKEKYIDILEDVNVALLRFNDIKNIDNKIKISFDLDYDHGHSIEFKLKKIKK